MACKESYYLKLKDEKDVNILFSIFHSWHLNGNKGQKWTMVSLKNRNSIQSKEKENMISKIKNDIRQYSQQLHERKRIRKKNMTTCMYEFEIIIKYF